jgi:outer membrane receptor protein involved in Fe transport
VSTLDQGQHLAAGYTAAISSRVMSITRVGVHASRRDNRPGQSGFDGFAALGITGPSLPSDDLAYPAIELPGYETLGDDPNLPVVRRTRTVHVASQLAVEGTRHRLKFGGDVRTYRSDGFNHLFSRGQISFTGGATGHPVADLLIGRPSFTLIAANDNRQALRTWNVAGFVQDSWRAAPTLTIDAGVRYEYQSPPIDAENRMRIFDLAARALVPVGRGGIPRSGVRADRNNVAPRIGVSWDLSNNGTLIVRGGYGLFYDAGTLIEHSALYFNPPYFTLNVFAPFDAPLEIRNPFPIEAGLTPPPAVNTLDPDFRTTYSHQAHAGVERVFGAFTLAGRYVTSRGRNLVRKRNINQPDPGPGPFDPRRPIEGFGDILLVESKASSTYHGLLVSADRQLFRGFAFHGAYTWSTSMDNASAFLASDGDDNTPQNSRDLASEWGPSDFDVRQRLVISGTWQVPAIGRSVLLRDWQVGAILTAQSGRPFTPRVSFDNSNTGNGAGATFGSDRPSVITGTPPPDIPIVRYGGHAFVIPRRFTFGSAQRNMLTGPGYAALDLLISRRVHVSRRTLEVRLEIFNLLNRRNDRLPDSFVDRATFGQSLATFPAREMQLAARLTF